MSTKQPKAAAPKSSPSPKAVPTLAGPGLLESPQTLGIIVALIVVLITIVYLLTRGKKKGRSVLLIGPTESGKTTIFSRLWQGKNVETVTSVVPNEGEYELANGRPNLLLKDLPGNERVRQTFWESNKSGVRGILCVIDAAGGSKAVRDCAEVLYWILTDSVVTSLKPNVLIFANKQDMATAKGIRVIRTSLEREITTLRLTKSASLQTTGGSTAAASKTLGKADRDFEFDHLLPLKVEYAEGVGNSDGDDDLKPVTEWLERIA